MQMSHSQQLPFAFSLDCQIDALMNIFSKYAATLRAEALKHDIRVRVLSTNRERLPPSVQEEVCLHVNVTGILCPALPSQKFRPHPHRH